MKARHRRQAHDLVHGKHLGRLNHAIDHQAVLGWINVPPALVVPLKMQPTGRNNAKQGLQWRKRHRGLRGLGQARALAALHVGFVFGRLAIALRRHTLAQAHAVRGKRQDVGVAPVYGHGVALGQRRRHGRTGSCRSKGIAQEIAAPALALSPYRGHVAPAQEVLGRLDQAPRSVLILHYACSSVWHQLTGTRRPNSLRRADRTFKLAY